MVRNNSGETAYNLLTLSSDTVQVQGLFGKSFIFPMARYSCVHCDISSLRKISLVEDMAGHGEGKVRDV